MINEHFGFFAISYMPCLTAEAVCVRWSGVKSSRVAKCMAEQSIAASKIWMRWIHCTCGLAKCSQSDYVSPLERSTFILFCRDRNVDRTTMLKLIRETIFAFYSHFGFFNLLWSVNTEQWTGTVNCGCAFKYYSIQQQRKEIEKNVCRKNNDAE